jgi:hypothetical protein
MPLYEGIVSAVKDGERVDVEIRPADACIPGAPGLSRHLCHCAADGSTLVIEALNRSGAAPGDLVLVARSAGPLIWNAVVLIGLPMIAAALGLSAAWVLTWGFETRIPTGILLISLTILGGLFVGTRLHRTLSGEKEAVIDRILAQSTEPGCPSNEKRDQGMSCTGCTSAAVCNRIEAYPVKDKGRLDGIDYGRT